MRQINVNVENDQGTSYNVHVYDLYGGGRTEVAGSPFQLAFEKPSPIFSVAADNRGNGIIEYWCEGGPLRTGIAVRDADTVHI